MQKIKQFFLDFFKTRGAGFYVMLAAAVIALTETILYGVYYQSAEMVRYYSQPAFLIPFFAVVGCLALSLFRVTAKWAPLVLYGLELCAFCLFIDSTYLYLSSAFYGGISASAIFGLSPGFLLGVLFYVIVFALSIASVFLKGRRERAGNAAAEEGK